MYRFGPLLGVCLVLGSLFLLIDSFRQQAHFEPLPLYTDFYPVERNATIDYRFAEPRAGLFWRDPLPAGGRLTLRVFSPESLPPRSLTLSSPAGELVTVAVTATPRNLTLLLPPGNPALRGYHVTFETAEARVDGDPRALGLLFDEIVLDVAPPPPPWPRYLAYMALIALTTALVFTVGLGPLAAGVAALLLTLLALSGSERFWWYSGALVIGFSVLAVYRNVAEPQRRNSAQRGPYPPQPLSLQARGTGGEGLQLSLPAWSAVFIAFAYTASIGRLVLLRHSYYGSSAYDLGLYDQTLYQISHFQPSYSTGAGLNMIGSHAALIVYPISTLYWILPDVRLLLLFQTVAIAASMLGFYLIGRDKGLPWLGVLGGALYLLHPAVQNLNLVDYHNDALAATLLIFMLWAAERRAWPAMFVFGALVMICKENFAFTTAMLGVYLVLRRDWQVGAGLLALSAAWFLFATEVIVPAFSNQSESLHVSRFTKYGDSVPELLLTAITQPQLLLGDMLRPEAPAYMVSLLLPLAFLPLLHPIGIVALPALAINLLSSEPAQRSLRFQYNALLVAVLAVAAVLAVIWLWQKLAGALRDSGLGIQDSEFRDGTMLRLTTPMPRLSTGQLVMAMLLGLLLVQLFYQQQFIDRRAEMASLIQYNGTRRYYYDYVLSHIPPAANVAVQSNMHPQLTHRQQVFIFSNPFVRFDFFDPAGMPSRHMSSTSPSIHAVTMALGRATRTVRGANCAIAASSPSSCASTGWCCCGAPLSLPGSGGVSSTASGGDSALVRRDQGVMVRYSQV
ncbi:DUF2079 domain-containing protein [Candidatus Gracilibacteria bacterium]|nr:DUF2079 domain-containing protein [Candidatus Gracilibacteria bacterium]